MCKTGFYFTVNNECKECKSENTYVFEETYCLNYSIPLYSNSNYLIPNQTSIQNNYEVSIFSQICSQTKINVESNPYDPYIFVYWGAIKNSEISSDFDSSFQTIKENALRLRGKLNYSSFGTYGFHENGNISVILANNIDYSIYYYCVKLFNHVKKSSKGQFSVRKNKEVQNYIIILQIAIYNTSEAKDDQFYLCILEKNLNLQGKKLFTTQEGSIFINILNFNLNIL